jgi:hypothetical protein
LKELHGLLEKEERERMMDGVRNRGIEDAAECSSTPSIGILS